MTDPSDEQLQRMIEIRDEMLRLARQTSALADNALTLMETAIAGREPPKPGRHKKHLRVVKGISIGAALTQAWRLFHRPATIATTALTGAALAGGVALLPFDSTPARHGPPAHHSRQLDRDHRIRLRPVDHHRPITATGPVSTPPRRRRRQRPVAPVSPTPKPLPTPSPLPPLPIPTPSPTCLEVGPVGVCLTL